MGTKCTLRVTAKLDLICTTSNSEIGQIMHGRYIGCLPIGWPSFMAPMTVTGIAFASHCGQGYQELQESL